MLFGNELMRREPVKKLLSWLFPPPPAVADHGDRPYVESDGWEWGWFPAISFIGAVCFIMMAVGINLARSNGPYHELIFWLGLLPFYSLVTWRLISLQPSRRERVSLVLLVGVGLYLVKLIHSPIYFTFYDELLHYRSAINIISSKQLFLENPLLPISPLYPGLENIAVALVNIGGLDLFSAGVLTILVARVVFVFVLFLFFERTSESHRLAGIATLIYAANPHFVFFDAQFSYESLALVFVVIVFLSIEYRFRHHKDRPLGASLLLIFGLCATMVTHHVTSYFLLICLILWAVVAYFFPYPGQSRTVLFGTASLALVAILSWMMYVAIITVDYLVPVLSGALVDLFRVLVREEAGRQLFSSTGGNVLEIWERVIVYGTALIILAGLLVGGLSVLREHRNRTTYLFLGLVGFFYPVTQLLRFSEKGPELASRIGPFMFFGIAFVIAIGVTKIFNSSEPVTWQKRAGITAFIVIMFWGNFLVSFPRWALMPGPYMASADTRSVVANSIDAAIWARDHLGPDQRIAADRINGLLMNAYGQKYQVTGSWESLNVPGIFLSAPFTNVERQTLCDGQVSYLVVDHRFTNSLPLLGFYFEAEERAGYYQEPLEAAVLEKFKDLDEFSLIYDDGAVLIYQVDLTYCDSENH
jgi:hypothetical protein